MVQSITLQTSDSDIIASDVLGRLSFAASSESSGSDAILVAASIYAEAEGQFTNNSNPTSLFFSTASTSAGAAFAKLKITSDGHLVPVQNAQYNLGSSANRFNSLFAKDVYAGSIDITNQNNANNSLFNIEGTNGNLFSVIDSVSGSLMSVNDITGLPIFEVFSDRRIVAGRFGQNDFVLSSAGNVGIGVEASETSKLSVKGSSILTTSSALNVTDSANDSLLFVRNDGRVGIGTSSPEEKLVVDGNIRLADTAGSTSHRFQIFRGGGSSYDYSISKEGNHVAISTANDANTQRAVQIGSHTGTTWNPKIHMNGWTGQVGLNTTSPQAGYILDANGAIVVRGNILTNGTIEEFSNSRFKFNSGSSSNSHSYVSVGGGNFGVGTTVPSTKLDVSGVITATGGNSTNWNTAFGWGNHASAGYLTSLTHTHGVANSGGTQQFTFGVNENIRFAGGGSTSVTFNAGTKLVTISSTDTNTTYAGSTSIILNGGSFERAALIGDVIASQNNNSTAIANGVVSNAKLASMNANTIKGRISSFGEPQDLTADNVRTIINVANGANNYVHPTDGGAGSTISAANLRVLSAITVNTLGHVTSVSSKDLTANDIPNISTDKLTSGTLGVSRGGTGVATLTANNILVGNGTNAISAPYTVETTLSGGSAAIPRADAVKNYVDNLLSANDAMVFKGTIGSSAQNATINVLTIDQVGSIGPSGFSAGWTYRVITPGTYVGSIPQEVGDLIIAIKDFDNGQSYTQAFNTYWTVVQTNIDGAVTGPASAFSGNFVIFNGTTGKVISDSGLSSSGAALTQVNDTNVTLTLGGSASSSLLRAASITAGWTGQLSVSRGGTGASSLTGVVIGNGTGAMTAAPGTANQLLRRNSSNTTYEFFTHDFVSTSRSLTINGTANQVTVAGGLQDLSANRTWTLSLPQDIHSSATPTFNGLTSNGTVNIRASASGSVATQIPVFVADPSSTTRAVVTRTPAQLLNDIGAYAASNPSGYTTNVGTVTSVVGTGTVSGLTLTGTVTTTGNLTLGGTLSVAASNFSSQTAKTFLAAPNASNGVPTFRTIVAADVPTLNQDTTGSANTLNANGNLTTQYGNNKLGFTEAITNGTTGLFAGSNNSNCILTLNRHPGDYYSQLGFSSNGNLYYRAFNNVAINTTLPWQTIWTSSSLTNLNQLTNGPGYTTNVGTVTSVAALTLGTTGTDVSSSVTNGTTTPVITLNIPTASASNRGALSSTDWGIFNAKQAAITGGASTITSSNLTVNRALVSDGSGKVAVSSVTSTELGYVSGVTSSIQTQLNSKQATITNPVTGTGTLNYISKWTSTSAQGNSIIFDNGTNVGIGTITPEYKLQVNGSFGATTKSFRIDHPSKPNYTLEYGSLESPYHGVRLTGRGKLIKGIGVVELPYYLKDLIHDDENINIQITNIKHSKTIYLDDIDLQNDKFIVKADRSKTLGELHFCWTLTGIRKDVENLVVEREQ